MIVSICEKIISVQIDQIIFAKLLNRKKYYSKKADVRKSRVRRVKNENNWSNTGKI